MKAAVYYGPSDVRIEERETPTAGDNDIVVKNLYAGISDMDVVTYACDSNTGCRITAGSKFGHEIISEVIQIGKNVKDIEEGMMVYPYPMRDNDDTKRVGKVGGFSEYMLIPNAKLNRQVYDIPARIPAREACLIEPFTVGFHAARRAEPKPNENAIVFGAGTIGIAAAIGLKYFGCKEVLICDHSDFRLEKAKALSFAVCNSSRTDLKTAAIAAFGTAPSFSGMTADVPIFIDTVGTSSILEQYRSVGKFESRMVVGAVCTDTWPVNVQELIYLQLSLIGSGSYTPEDVEDVIAVMVRKRWDIESVITDEFTQEQISQAIERAADADHALKVLIQY